MTAFLWPVETCRGEVVAWCFDYDTAVDLVNGTTDRELYIGAPHYDTPAKRARLAAKLDAWRIEELRPLNGRARIAA